MVTLGQNTFESNFMLSIDLQIDHSLYKNVKIDVAAAVANKKERNKQQLDLSATAVALVDLAQPLAAVVVCGALLGREYLLISDSLLFAGAWTFFKTRV